MDDALKEHMNELLKKGVRMDGRKLTEFRPIVLKTGIVATAEGSCQITCGEANVIVGIKLEVGTPYPDRPDQGTMMVNAELRPISNPEFEVGPPGEEAIEVSRVIDRSIRESKAIDEKGLCIKAGEKAWIVDIDVCPVNHDGNLIDIGGLAAVAALRDVRFPKLDEANHPDYHEKTKRRLELSCLPLPVTVVKIGENLLIDPTQDEMRVADARLTVASLEDGSICALQKGGSSPITLEDLGRMIDLAVETAQELRKLLD